jgi:hypothetical protein
MGFLDKTNPAATRDSVIRWAIGTGIAPPILLLVFGVPVPAKFLPFIALVGSGIGACIEWQLDDGEEKETEFDQPSGVWDREFDT